MRQRKLLHFYQEKVPAITRGTEHIRDGRNVPSFWHISTAPNVRTDRGHHPRIIVRYNVNRGSWPMSAAHGAPCYAAWRAVPAYSVPHAGSILLATPFREKRDRIGIQGKSTPFRLQIRGERARLLIGHEKKSLQEILITDKHPAERC